MVYGGSPPSVKPHSPTSKKVASGRETVNLMVTDGRQRPKLRMEGPVTAGFEMGDKSVSLSLEETVRPRLVFIVDRWFQLREKWRAYDTYLAGLLIFAASRFVVILGVKFGSLLSPIPDPTRWDGGKAWYYGLVRWDSGHYADIATKGYRHSSDPSALNTTAFYPLYPIMARAAKLVFGTDIYVALLLVANVASLCVALLLTKFVREEEGDETALWSLAFFCFFPTSMFLSAGYTEPLCLVFVLLCLITLRQNRFVLAAAFAGLSIATRSTGVVLIPVILWEIWSRRDGLPWPRLVLKLTLCGVLAGSGLLAYMAYLSIAFGNSWAFATSQAAWHTGTFVSRITDAITLGPILHIRWESSVFLCFLALAIWSFRRLPTAVSLYALGSLLLPYLTLGISLSTNRFVLMCFPAFICLAILCKSRPLLASAVIGIFGAILLQTSAMFSQWYFVG